MTTILTEAQTVVDGPRAESYGPPHVNHSTTAGLFAGWLHRRHGPNRERIDAIDICAFNILQKLSRLAHSPDHRDSLVDICGYARNWEMLICGIQEIEAEDHQIHLALTSENWKPYKAPDPSEPNVGDGRPTAYLAARYSRNAEMRQVAERLRSHGIVVTSRWINGGHEMSKEATTEEAQLDRARFAMEDWQDLEQADVVVSFTEEPRGSNSRGGRHVEFGAALAMGKRCIVVGPLENVFHCLPQVEHCEEDVLPWVIRRADPCPADPYPDQEPEPTVSAPVDGVERVVLDAGNGKCDVYRLCPQSGWINPAGGCAVPVLARALSKVVAQRKRAEAAERAYKDAEGKRIELEAALPHWRTGMRMLEYLSPTPRITAILTEARSAGLTWEEAPDAAE